MGRAWLKQLLADHKKKSVAKSRRLFVELFAGSAGLTAAVRETGVEALSLDNWTPDGMQRTDFDLT